MNLSERLRIRQTDDGQWAVLEYLPETNAYRERGRFPDEDTARRAAGDMIKEEPK